MQYRRAVRENTNVLVALAGASGSGKTYSGMQLATGICGDDPFLMVDTEARRGLHYADQFDFEHVSLRPPFTPQSYLAAVKDGAARGFKAILLDSGSHEWEGEGGVLEMADADNRKAPSNWIKPKQEHKRWVNGLLQSGVNLIICLRAQEKIAIDDSGPRIVIHNDGWQPICEKRFMFEMTVSFTLNPLRPGVVDLGLPHKLQDQHRMMFPPDRHITAEAGAGLGAWARGESIDVPDKALWERARREAHKGKKALRMFGASLSADERLLLRPIGAELKRTAKLSDENRGGNGGDATAPEASPPATAEPHAAVEAPASADIRWS